MLTVIGFPRSGTGFLHRMLAHYIDGPGVEVWPGTPVHPKVRKIHWEYQVEDDDQLVYIYRDPRDCALSGWNYVKNGFEPGLSLMEFLECHFSGHWELWPTGWREHTLRWLDKGVPTVLYEMLCRHREPELRWLVTELGMEVEGARMVHAISHSYDIGECHDGRWVKELPLEAAKWIDRHCGDLMPVLGCP